VRRGGVFAAALLLVGLVGSAAFAVEPNEMLKDPAQEARARALSAGLRCLVCQNESIDDSDADLAADLRRIVRGQIRAGRSDAEIRAFLLARYGQFVLLQPRFSIDNLVLWTVPFIVVLGGGSVMILRRRKTPETAPLTEEEQARLARLQETPGP